MRTSSCTPKIIKLLEHQHFIRLLRKFVIPFMLRWVLETHRLINILKNPISPNNKISMRNTNRRSNTKRMFINWFNRSPRLSEISTPKRRELTWLTFTIITLPFSNASVSSGRCLCNTFPACQLDWSRCAAKTAGWWMAFLAASSFLKELMWKVEVLMRVPWWNTRTLEAPVLKAGSSQSRIGKVRLGGVEAHTLLSTKLPFLNSIVLWFLRCHLGLLSLGDFLMRAFREWSRCCRGWSLSRGRWCLRLLRRGRSWEDLGSSWDNQYIREESCRRKTLTCHRLATCLLCRLLLPNAFGKVLHRRERWSFLDLVVDESIHWCALWS